LKDEDIFIHIRGEDAKYDRLFLTRFSTINQADKFLKDVEHQKHILSQYDGIIFNVESLHKKQVATAINFIRSRPNSMFYVPTVDRLLKTSDESLIDLPTNINFFAETNTLSYPANADEIKSIASEARVQSDILSRQASKRFKSVHRVGRRKSPRRPYCNFYCGSKLSKAIAKGFTPEFLKEELEKDTKVSKLKTQEFYLERKKEEIEEAIRKKQEEVSKYVYDEEAAELGFQLGDQYETFLEFSKKNAECVPMSQS
jgi:hypothetical protein